MDVKLYPASTSYLPSLFTRYFEYILLLVVALIGLICSAFALAETTPSGSNMPYTQFVSLDLGKKSEFDKHVQLTGEHKNGATLSFHINLDLAASRYVMDMGDGNRMIITQNDFDYTYFTKGEYLLELKEINRGLISLIGDKKLKIR
jgi:hypothetical protein